MKKSATPTKPASQPPLPTLTSQELYQIYIRWLSTPRQSRNPPTTDTFCATYGTLPATLLSFQESPAFEDDLLKETTRWAKRRTPELLHLLYEKIRVEQSAADLRLWKELLEASQESDLVGSQTNIVNIFNPTDEQRAQILERLQRRTRGDSILPTTR